jgi:hypothetical protein
MVTFMQKHKYITWETADGIPSFVIFPGHLQHVDMWDGICENAPSAVTPVGAGFIGLHMTVRSDAAFPSRTTVSATFLPSGRSDSLDLGVHDTDFDTLNT